MNIKKYEDWLLTEYLKDVELPGICSDERDPRIVKAELDNKYKKYVLDKTDKPKVKHRYALHRMQWTDCGYGCDRHYECYAIFDNYLQQYLLKSGEDYKYTEHESDNLNDFIQYLKYEPMSYDEKDKLRKLGIRL